MLAIDGKTLRRSFDRAAGRSPLHVVTAFGADARLSVGQRAVAPGENEITATRALLATLTLDGALVMALASCDYIRRHHNVLITGPCGVGKSWLVCALGERACREDFSAAYHRMPRLLAALALARGDGRHARLLNTLGRVDLVRRENCPPDSFLILLTPRRLGPRAARCRPASRHP